MRGTVNSFRAGAAAACLGVLSTSAFAQLVPPGAEPGRVEQRFEQVAPPRAEPSVVQGLESTMPAAEAARIKLVPRAIRVDGSSVFSAADLAPFYRDLIGREVTLLQIFEAAAKITAHYGQEGYLLSRVIVPPQELDPKGAVIRLQAVEGYIDEVVWPEGLDRYRDFFTSYAAKITGKRPIRAAEMERYLLLAGDLPGLSFRSNLKASERHPGASTLYLQMERKAYDASISADNHGTDASGPYEGVVSARINNAFGLHERLSAGYAIAGPTFNSAKPELHYLSFGYDQVLNSEGLTFSLSGNASWGDPGTPILVGLAYQTRGFNLTGALSYPFIRSRSRNLTGTLAFDLQNAQGFSTAGLATDDRLRVVRAELSYDFADRWNGINQAILSASQGIQGLGSTTNANPNASRIPGSVDFFKATLFLSRQQPLPGRFSVFGSAFGQVAAQPLLSAQECGYGGRRFGRGFDSSLITGDHCLLLNAELRYDFGLSGGMSRVLDHAQAYLFADYGRIWNITPPAGTPATDDGASVGLGLRFSKAKFSADIAVSRTVKEPASVVNPPDWMGWFKLTATF